MNMKVKVKQIITGALGTIPKGLVRGLEELEIGGRAVIIGQNTEKSPGDLRTLAFTRTPVTDHQQTLVGKILEVEYNNNNNDNNNNQRKRNESHVLGLCQKIEKVMRVTVISISIGALGTVPKGLEREQEEVEIGGRIETI